MIIIHDIWLQEDRYSNRDVIKSCWRKVKILPSDWNQGINNEVVSDLIPEGHKMITDEEYEILCSMMKEIMMKTITSKLDTCTIALILSDFFAAGISVNHLSKDNN